MPARSPTTRTLAAVPQLEAHLCSGSIGQDSVRALARTVKAVRRTGLDPAAEAGEILRVAREQGARAGLERVRTLEGHLDPGSIEQRHAQARERSFARITITPHTHRCTAVKSCSTRHAAQYSKPPSN